MENTTKLGTDPEPTPFRAIDPSAVDEYDIRNGGGQGRGSDTAEQREGGGHRRAASVKCAS